LREKRAVIRKRDVPGEAGMPPQERYHVAYPIEVANHVHGVVALELAPRSAPRLQGAMRQLQWGAAWLEVLFHRQRTTAQGASQERPQTALELIATILEQPRFQAAATAFVTALATRLACDRVSVGFVRRGRVRVRAISHTAHFGKKTNLTRALEAAMEEAYDQAAVVTSPPTPTAPFRITHAHQEYARQHGAGALCSVPLSHDGQVLGVLMLERPDDQPFPAATLALCEAVAALAGPILEQQRRDDRWLITKAVEALHTQLGRLVGPRHVIRKLVVVGLAAVVTFLAVARGDYRVAATTFIEPAIKRAILAPFEGYIAEAQVRAGDLVHAGDVLCSLDDRDLKLERLKWRGQREQYAKQYQQAMALRNAPLAQIVTAQIAQAEAELARVEEYLERARVRAPFEGLVVTGDLSQSIGAPVERGHTLFEVAPLETYRVILEVDERDVAQLAVAQQGHLVLAAFPHDPLSLSVAKLTPVSSAREGRNYFRVEAQLAETPARLRPGMEGVSKVTIDRRLLVWIWTHQAIDWLRLTLWSWWP
jgi:multidrug resistance efflux pump